MKMTVATIEMTPALIKQMPRASKEVLRKGTLLGYVLNICSPPLTAKGTPSTSRKTYIAEYGGEYYQLHGNSRLEIQEWIDRFPDVKEWYDLYTAFTKDAVHLYL